MKTRAMGRGRRGARAGIALIAFGAGAATACQALVGIESSQVTNGDASPAGKPDGNGTLIPLPPDSAPAQALDANPAADADQSSPCACSTDAGVPDAADAADAAECSSGDHRCSGNTLQKCGATSQWEDDSTCAAYCRNAQCETPPSCSSTFTTCGTASDPRSCCGAHAVPGGTFKRDYDAVTAGHTDPSYTAKVADFLLDDFEVTVERFQRFVDAYPATAPDAGTSHGSMPTAGSGKNANDPNDPGWDPTWPLPKDRTELTTLLTSGPACDAPTWGVPDHRPLTCAPWYVAYAFCIWDGGRLPTEAEWNYAAAGGGGADGQRVYPWSSPPSSLTITAQDGVFHANEVAPVGSRLPRGVGKWLQADLGGNLAEWVADTYVTPYAKNPCDNCADHSVGTDRVIRGGSFSQTAEDARVGIRVSSPQDFGFSYIGFRCARSK